MSDRDARVREFLALAGWADADGQDLAGDMSSRRYTRLTRADGQTAILMNAPPGRDATTPAFVRMTRWLRSAHISAPEILADQSDDGLLLLEDFGDRNVSNLVAQNPHVRDAVYIAIIDLLVLIRAQEEPELIRPDASALIDMTRLADEYYPGLESDRIAPFRALLETIIVDLMADESSVSLRDFHADNLMWLPERSGLARLGLLDYQDAFLTHPVYDLVSLLTDARTRIESAFRKKMIAAYAERTTDDPERLALAFAAFSAQRNLRILGVFCRAARVAGNTSHVPKLPRVHDYLAEALSHPAFADVASETLAAIPRPNTNLIEALS